MGNDPNSSNDLLPGAVLRILGGRKGTLYYIGRFPQRLHLNRIYYYCSDNDCRLASERRRLARLGLRLDVSATLRVPQPRGMASVDIHLGDPTRHLDKIHPAFELTTAATGTRSIDSY